MFILSNLNVSRSFLSNASPGAMIINLLTLPGSYWLYRERMIYHQAASQKIEIQNS